MPTDIFFDVMPYNVVEDITAFITLVEEGTPGMLLEFYHTTLCHIPEIFNAESCYPKVDILNFQVCTIEMLDIFNIQEKYYAQFSGTFTTEFHAQFHTDFKLILLSRHDVIL